MVVSPGKKKGLKDVSEKARTAAAAVSDLISSMTLAVEEKVALEHQIHNLARESEYMINGIDNISKNSQKKVLLAYRKFLQENVEAVDERLKQLKRNNNK
jgi:hypothetical protein